MICADLYQVVHILVKRQCMENVVVPKKVLQAIILTQVIVRLVLWHAKASRKLRNKRHQETQYVLIQPRHNYYIPISRYKVTTNI